MFPDEPLCRSDKGKLSKEKRKEVGKWFHSIRCGQTSDAIESAFADYVREALRLSLAVRGAR
jgi:hypothetical protein